MTDSDAAAPAEAVVLLDDDGKAFDVPVGQVVEFALGGSRSGTGYEWVPKRFDPRIVAQAGGRSTESEAAFAGAPKVDLYRFIAKTAGTTSVEMGLERPFATAPPVRMLHVTIRVH